MMIPKGIPGPGQVAKRITGQITGASSPKTGGVEQKPGKGLHSPLAIPSSRSSAGLMLEAMMATHKAAMADLAGGRDARTASHSSKIETLKEKKAETADRHAQERNAAWTNVALAVASAGTSVVTAGFRAAVAGTSAAPSALGRLAIGQRVAIVDTIAAVQQNATDAAKSAFEKVAEGAVPGDINALIQHVLKESYLETSKDLAFHADKVKSFNDQKEAIRDQFTQARAGGASSSPREEIKRMEEMLSTVGDDAQLANIDLQNALQNAQQTLQTMSNVSKMLHDTGMAIIRKIG